MGEEKTGEHAWNVSCAAAGAADWGVRPPSASMRPPLGRDPPLATLPWGVRRLDIGDCCMPTWTHIPSQFHL